jgi:hypothetical protein
MSEIAGKFNLAVANGGNPAECCIKIVLEGIAHGVELQSDRIQSVR